MYEFKRLEQQDLNKLNSLKLLTLTWECCESTFKILSNETIVGLIEITCNLPNLENTSFIFNFEVVDKGKGIGTDIIKNIIYTSYSNFRLIPLNIQSKNFWEKLGFKSDGEEMVYSQN